MPFTPTQQKAIDLRDKNILVSAAAGSGKTAVLTTRLVNRVLELVDIDKFLVVTFTDAAATEMKERIEAQLQEHLRDADDSLHAHIEKQLTLLPTVSISTIHGFCYRLITVYFNELDLEPNMKISNEIEINLLKQEVMEQVIEEELDKASSEFYAVMDTYGDLRGTNTIVELLLSIYNFSRSIPFPEKWLDEKLVCFCENKIYEQSILEGIKQEIDSLKDIITEAKNIANQPNGPVKYLTALEEDENMLSNINTDTLEKVNKSISIKFATLNRKQDADPELKEKVQLLREVYKDHIKNIKSQCSMPTDNPRLDNLIKEIIRLVNVFTKKYSDIKKDRGLLDFNDLEQYALKILVNENGNATEIAIELSKFYKEIYIDEYQDVNNVQETILKALTSKGATIFMVGDMKQSIYRFRLANPQIFSEKYDDFKTKLPSNNIAIDLSQNFRSRENVLRSVNEIFEQLLSKDVGDLEYDKNARLEYGNLYDKKYNDPCSEIHIIENNTKAHEDNEDSNEEDKDTTEAKLIVKLIKQMLETTQIYDKEINEYRKATYKDVVILLRAKTSSVIFEEELINAGINAYAEVNKSFFEATEIRCMINYLQIIDNIDQDIPLISVLRSPIVGVDFEKLSAIRNSDLTGTFYQALVEYLSQNEDIVLRDFIENIKYFKELSTIVTVEELISEIYLKTGYYRYICALGEQKIGNLHILKTEAQCYEENVKTGLFSFINYLKKVETLKDKLEQAKVNLEQDNVVKIMSIHKSKGLEFPIVILAQAGKQFNNKDISKPILLHNELGFGTKYKHNYIKYPTISQIAIKNRIHRENISEEMRILYVALTRAREKLVITGISKEYAKLFNKSKIYATRNTLLVNTLLIRKQKSYLEWIMLSLMTNKNIGDISINGYNPKANWMLKKWSVDEITKDKSEKRDTHQFEFEHSTQLQYTNNKDEIFKKLNYTYKNKAGLSLPHKVSVSYLKNEMQHDAKVDKYIPRFDNIQNALLRGSIIHSVFENIDYLQNKDYNSLGRNLTELVEQNKIDKQALKLVRIDKLVEFANSDIINRMRKSCASFKEQPFVYKTDAKIVNSDAKEHTVLLQGIIDAYFEEEDGIVLIDYKTDKTTNIDDIKQRYTMQIDLYATALEGLTQKTVKHKLLYLYNNNDWVEI
ncbi:MAG: helicase-exonuclease AddAB subunit AddA [Epulopiscium sp. Nuni2H_MBin003]|nr:MAG: helicase-exonuclease AddAB subunit AddA [Epulopiscium sp. Nuni2H_MBin003]